jgi:asparagine synthase (glutamine-hydrolysing)
MVDKIRHRGPDENAVLHRGEIGLGISRLAIIDPGGSHQPISNEDESVFIVFNGEIYNYRQLRVQLEETGHRFATRGDGEAIVHGYEEWGHGVFERLRGMFAIAIWDERERRLLLARDRIGIKPLYLHNDGNRLVFASEVKSILEAGVEAVLRSETLDCHLAFRYLPAPDTIFKGIRKLPPGEILIIDEKGETPVRYHRFELRPKHDVTEHEAVERLLELLKKSVEYRMQSDAPLGVFLSGGLDSGFLVAVARNLVEGKLDTFTIGFNRGGIYNETEAAAVVARRFSTEQHNISMDHVDFVTMLPRSVYHMDEPMADPSSVPMQALSELAGENVKVILSGEGGDELFAGYGRYIGEAVAGRFRFPEALNRRIARGLRKRISRRLRRGIEGVGISDAIRRHLFWLEIVEEADRRRLLSREGGVDNGGIDPLNVMMSISSELEAGDDLDRLFYFDMKAWLVEDLLLKKDKMGMSASIEARVPYLDQDVVEFALKLPFSMKVRGKRGKDIFRKLLAEWLPREILERPKVGFAVPINSWFRHELAPLLSAQLTGKGSFLAEIVDPAGVVGLIEAHMAGEDQSVALYALLILDIWGRIFLSGESPESLSLSLKSLISN